MHDVYDPFSPVQGQQRLRAAGNPLLPLPIPSDLHQELTIASRQGRLRRFASSHRRLLFSESRTICSCSSKSNLLNYLGYSPLVPLSYFKIVIWRDGNQTPGTLGFVLDQNFLIEDLPEEAIDPGVFKIRQKRISRIQQDLDINFGIVSEWDQMPLSDDDESLDDGVLLTSVNDIVIARKR